MIVEVKIHHDYLYLARETSPGGGEINLCNDGDSIWGYLWGWIPGRHKQLEFFVVVNHLFTNLDDKTRTWKVKRDVKE